MIRRQIPTSSFYGLLLVCALAAANRAADLNEPADPKDVAAVVKRVTDAVGGETKLLKLFRIKERLILGSDGTKPGSERLSILEPPNYWWLGKKERVSQEKEPAIFLVWTWTLGALTDPKSKLELLPDSKDGEVHVFGVRISDTINPPLEAWFSKQDNRLVKIDWRKDTHRFSEWKETDGVSYPSLTVGHKPDGRAWYYSTIVELTPLPELPEGLSR